MSPLKSNMVSTRSREDLIWRRSNLTIMSFGLLFILFLTLFPFGFSFRETYSNLGYHFLLLGWGKSNILDVQRNLLLFIPFGFGFTGYLMKIIRLPRLYYLLGIILSRSFKYFSHQDFHLW